jgi:hypothetical protein
MSTQSKPLQIRTTKASATKPKTSTPKKPANLQPLLVNTKKSSSDKDFEMTNSGTFKFKDVQIGLQGVKQSLTTPKDTPITPRENQTPSTDTSTPSSVDYFSEAPPPEESILSSTPPRRGSIGGLSTVRLMPSRFHILIGKNSLPPVSHQEKEQVRIWSICQCVTCRVSGQTLCPQSYSLVHGRNQSQLGGT